jgi:S-adenosylmethionine hydrolase
VARGQLFVGPDNGLFSLVAPAPDAAYEIAAAGFRAERVSPTFHGRDVFAVAAARLAAGAAPERAGPPVALAGRLPGAEAGAPRVVHVDAFGNLITDVPGERVPAGARVRVAGREAPLARTFADVAPGELVAYVGSGGTLEIAVREGSAAERLGAGRGAPVVVEP